MSRRPVPRDAKILRCPAGCGGWVYRDAKQCGWCGAQLDRGSAARFPSRRGDTRSPSEPPTPNTSDGSGS